MKSRIPFVATVVGALLVGGATTGGTFASWKDSSTLTGASISSGTMDFVLGSPTTLASLTNAAGAEGTATFVATDTGTGKNLVQRITAAVANTPTGVTAYVAAGNTCAGITTASASADKSPSDASRTQTYCVRVVSSGTAVSGNVTLNVTGAQRPSGWVAPAKTVTIPVTITQAGAGVPTLTCAANQADPNARTFNWNNLGTGVTYQVYRQGPSATSFTAFGAAQTATTFTETLLNKDETSFFKVKSIKNGVESAFGSTVTITRNGNSANYNCSVTP